MSEHFNNIESIKKAKCPVLIIHGERDELIPATQRQRETDTLNALLAGFGRRQTVLKVLRREARLRAWLKIWLYLHVPVTVALLGALTVHIVSVFVYW